MSIKGRVSIVIFLVILLFSSLANFIANDKPLLVKYKGSYYFPVFKNYSEKTFGGELDSIADYKEEFVISLIKKDGYIIMPPIEYSYDTINYNLPTAPPSRPSKENWLGTDSQGRDVLARYLYGMRISIYFGILLTIISFLFAFICGSIQGYCGGLVDLIGQRILEIWSSVPILFILIILAGTNIFALNFWTILLIVAMFNWISLLSPIRAEFLKNRNANYVKAAQMMGLSTWSVITKHILPNSIIISLATLPFILSEAVITIASLDFLGLGLPPESPSLGRILAEAKNNPKAIWIGLTGFFSLVTLLTVLVFIGEEIRNWLKIK